MVEARRSHNCKSKVEVVGFVTKRSEQGRTRRQGDHLTDEQEGEKSYELLRHRNKCSA